MQSDTQPSDTQPSDAKPAPVAVTPRPFSRQDYLDAAKPRYGSVTTGDGRIHYFRSVSQSELAAFEYQFFDDDGKIDEAKWSRERQGRLLALTLVDQHGERLFADDDWQILANADAAVMTPVVKAINQHLTGTEGAQKN